MRRTLVLRREARIAFSVAVLVVVSVLAAGCGTNEPGDPVGPARDLAAPVPKGTDVNVYCVKLSRQKDVETCYLDLNVPSTVSESKALAFWYRVSATVRDGNRTVFEYHGKQFRFDEPFLNGETITDDWAAVGWRCPSDDGLAQKVITRRMDTRSPYRVSGYQSVGEARQDSCIIDIFPTQNKVLVPWQGHLKS